jgi:hypothetical protein
MLFAYRNPGRNRLFISRIFLLLSLVIFLLLGIVLSFSDVKVSYGAAGDTMLFFHGAVLTVSSLFLIMPSLKLIRAISWPVLQVEDARCVRISGVMFSVLVVIFLARGIWDITSYFEVNTLALEVSRLVDAADPRDLPATVRWFYFLFEFIVATVCTIVFMIVVIVIRQHERGFADDPFYAEDCSTKPMLESGNSNEVARASHAPI